MIKVTQKKIVDIKTDLDDGQLLDFIKKELETEEDVLDYIEALKEAYLKRIKENIRITL